MNDLREKYNHPAWREDYITERATFYKYAEVIGFINKKITAYSDPANEHPNSAKAVQSTNLGSIPTKNVINFIRIIATRFSKPFNIFSRRINKMSW
jgi:hypothetical protein